MLVFSHAPPHTLESHSLEHTDPEAADNDATVAHKNRTYHTWTRTQLKGNTEAPLQNILCCKIGNGGRKVALILPDFCVSRQQNVKFSFIERCCICRFDNNFQDKGVKNVHHKSL